MPKTQPTNFPASLVAGSSGMGHFISLLFDQHVALGILQAKYFHSPGLLSPHLTPNCLLPPSSLCLWNIYYMPGIGPPEAPAHIHRPARSFWPVRPLVTVSLFSQSQFSANSSAKWTGREALRFPAPSSGLWQYLMARTKGQG